MTGRTRKWIEKATRRSAKRCSRDRWTRPDGWFEYAAWDDDWRSTIMDQLVKLCGGDEAAFAAGAVVLLVGWQVGYDG